MMIIHKPVATLLLCLTFTCIGYLLASISVMQLSQNTQKLDNPINAETNTRVNTIATRQTAADDTESQQNAQLTEQFDIKALLVIADSFAQSHLAYQSAASLDESQLKARLAQLYRISSPDANRLSKILFSRYVSLKGESALAFYLELYQNDVNKSPTNKALVYAIYHYWLSTDQAAALASLNTLAPEALKQDMSLYVIKHAALTSAQQTAFIQSLPAALQ